MRALRHHGRRDALIEDRVDPRFRALHHQEVSKVLVNLGHG